MGLALDIIKSWCNTEGNVNSTEELLKWIQKLNKDTYVNINECSINDSTFWFYDDYNGEILNRKRSFFSIMGMRYFENDNFVKEQPVIIQPEIGYLGIICRKIDGVINFLMQAKIEPGNINCVQISPTIQATKSNFTRAHGGNLPAYFSLFEQSSRYDVIYDQIQSEQGSRFYQKRNRNMIMIVNDDIEVLPNFKWMTLGQIKQLMKVDNLVNMDTRTVLSGLPIFSFGISESEKSEICGLFKEDEALFKSIFCSLPHGALPDLFHKINDYKMFRDIRTVQVPLNQLVDWKINEYGIICKKASDFMVRYYDIEISGREVRCWTQPLFKAIGKATFGLVTKIIGDTRKYLVKLCPEIGTFDKVELGPTVQWEPTHYLYNDDTVEKVFREKLENNEGIMFKSILSEEGGRFYHEQNYNVIIEVSKEELCTVPENYSWADYCTLNYLGQMNNCLNIQLRNLMALIQI